VSVSGRALGGTGRKASASELEVTGLRVQVVRKNLVRAWRDPVQVRTCDPVEGEVTVVARKGPGKAEVWVRRKCFKGEDCVHWKARNFAFWGKEYVLRAGKSSVSRGNWEAMGQHPTTIVSNPTGGVNGTCLTGRNEETKKARGWTHRGGVYCR